MALPSLSPVVEEYLEAIYRLEEKENIAKMSRLVRELNVSAGTVSNTIERLEELRLVAHIPYRGVKLTQKGKTAALDVIRRHRLSELLLANILDVEWSKVHEEACRLEHGISREVARHIERKLGMPKTCPHGNPIPDENGNLKTERFLALAKLKVGERGVVTRILKEEPAILDYLEKHNIKPGVEFQVRGATPLEGLILLDVNGKRVTISASIASLIGVKRC